MRKISYLSPTSLNLFRKDPKKFYRDYLADTRPVKMDQTGAMSVGSGFDAYVKSNLVKDLFGEATGRFDLETLLKEQVSPSNLKFAREAGRTVFESYVRSGAYGELILEMQQSSMVPRFEFTAKERIAGEGVLEDIGGVPLLGKPDATFVDSGGNRCILDWKVNGYCSKSAVSPSPGYALCRDGNYLELSGKNSRSHRTSHVDFVGSVGAGLRYNTAKGLEDTSPEWAVQLAIYGWLAGEPIGSNFLTVIDQIACDNSKGFEVPLIRVASHRAFVGKKFQEDLFRSAVAIWGIIESGWIFRDMTEDDSRKLQEVMDRGVVHDEVSGFLSENMPNVYRG